MRVFIRIILAAACWLGGTLLGFIVLLVSAGWPTGEPYGPSPIILLPAMAFYGSPVWLIFFVPLFFAVRDRSLWWQPWLSGIFGAAAGLIGLMVLLGGTLASLVSGPADERLIAWVPLFIGAFTFLLGSIVKQQYVGRFWQWIERPAARARMKSPEEY